MTYAPNADKFEVGKQYTVSSTYRGKNANKLTIGATVTVFKVETLEEADFQSDIDNLDTFCTIIVKDENGDRFYVKASDLVLNETPKATEAAPVALVTAEQKHQELRQHFARLDAQEKREGTVEQKLWFKYLTNCSDREYDRAVKLREKHGDSIIYSLV